jgi:hypothetical protein
MILLLSQGKRYGLPLDEMLLGQTGNPHLHDNMLNGEFIHFKDPFLGCMVGSDTKWQGERVRGKLFC